MKDEQKDREFFENAVLLMFFGYLLLLITLAIIS